MDEHNLKLSIDDLKGKQSVRATFRLSQQTIELLSVIASQLGIKQKSLFDHLVDDPGVLGQLAQEVQEKSIKDEDRRQKTFVMSRSSLVSLDMIARKRRIPRDRLVEISIKRLLPVIQSELKKHEKRKLLLQDLEAYLEHGQNVLEKTKAFFGRQDQLTETIKQQVDLSRRNVKMLKSIIEKGKALENW